MGLVAKKQFAEAMLTSSLLFILLAAAAHAAAPLQPCNSSSTEPWCNASLPLQHRVDMLLAALRDDELPPLLSNNLFGGIPAVERLRLPSYTWINEADHGLLKVNITPLPTSFPQIGLVAATFNTSLFRAIGVATAREAFALHVQGQQSGLLLHNNINIFRDPRWGRGQETPGEDPFLTSIYAQEWVTGIQQLHDGRMLAAAACKHLAAYSFEGVVPHSRHSFNALVSKQDMVDTYLPAFEACVKAGAKGLMCSYNALNGTPACANKALLTDTMRDSLGFDGVIVTDCDAVSDLAPNSAYDSHEFVKTKANAAFAAMHAGVDLDCGDTFRNNAFLLTSAMLRIAARRSLNIRFELGEFDFKSKSRSQEVNWEDHKTLAHESVVQGIVLLKNRQEVLPLRRGIRLAVYGPMANASDELLGDYSSSPVHVVRILEGLKNHAKEIVSQTAVADICAEEMTLVSRPDADAVVLLVGLMGEDRKLSNPDIRGNLTECRSSCLEAEGCDRRTLGLPRGQVELIRHSASWGLPLVLVVVSGGPVDLEEFSEDSRVHSILWTGYPGQQAGTGISSVLFGDSGPSGRLPITFYKSSYTSAVPVESMGMRPNLASGWPGRTYRFVEDRFVIYQFGFGLSYDSWTLSWLPHVPSSTRCDLHMEVTLADPVKRTAGAGFVVLLFLKPPTSASKSAPVKQLRGFERIHLKPGQRRSTLRFRLQRNDFDLVNIQGEKYFMPGRWTVEINAPAQLSRVLDVSADACQPQPSEMHLGNIFL